MTPIEQYQDVGFRHARNLMDAYERENGGLASMTFLFGMLKGIARFNSERRGTQDTFNLLTNVAEQEIAPDISLKMIEAEIAAELRKGMGE